MEKLPENDGLAWYCLRSQLKREHIAASVLSSRLGLEVCFPRIKYRKKTSRGAVIFKEALFPGYFFAKLSRVEKLVQVRSMIGVSGVVHFNQRYHPLPDVAVDELRQKMGSSGILIVREAYETGDPVTIVSGSFTGLNGLVHSYQPARERVIVLMDFLGKESKVAVKVSSVLPDKLHPLVR